MILFLTRGIPYLKLDILSVDSYHFTHKRCADLARIKIQKTSDLVIAASLPTVRIKEGLQEMLTVDSLYGLKLLVTKRRTSDDFPTPVSPNKTHFTSRGFESDAISSR
jgi:hypothetical protein